MIILKLNNINNNKMSRAGYVADGTVAASGSGLGRLWSALRQCHAKVNGTMRERERQREIERERERML